MHYADISREVKTNCEKYGFDYLGAGGSNLKSKLLGNYYIGTKGHAFSDRVANLLCDKFYRAINYPMSLASNIMPSTDGEDIDVKLFDTAIEKASIVMRINPLSRSTSSNSWEADLELIDFSYIALKEDDDLFDDSNTAYHYMTAPREYALALMKNFKDRPKLGDLEKIGRERGWQFQGFSDVRTALLLASQLSSGESDGYRHIVIDIEDTLEHKIGTYLCHPSSLGLAGVCAIDSLLHNLKGHLEYRAIPLYHTDSLPINVNDLQLRAGEEMLPINSMAEYWDESFIKTYYYDPLEGKEWNLAVGFHQDLSGVERIYAGVRCIGTTLEKEIAKRIRVRSAKF